MFAKIFTSLWRGSLRGHSDAQHVFIYLLAHADEWGSVEAMPQAIADETGLGLEAVEAAIAHLEAPDLRSRTPTDEGRRIQRLEEHRNWAWMITNYERYRAICDREKVREQTRDRVRRFRERAVTDSNASVTTGNASNGKVEGRRQRVEDRGQRTEEGNVVESLNLNVKPKKGKDTGTASRSRFTPPTLGEVTDYCRERSNRVDPGLWYDHYSSNGWRVGRNPMRSWKAAVRTWEKNGVQNGNGRGRGSTVSASDVIAFGRKLQEQDEKEARGE